MFCPFVCCETVTSQIILPCLGPSSCLRIGGHRHGHQGSPHSSVSCTLNTTGIPVHCLTSLVQRLRGLPRRLSAATPLLSSWFCVPSKLQCYLNLQNLCTCVIWIFRVLSLNEMLLLLVFRNNWPSWWRFFITPTRRSSAVSSPMNRNSRVIYKSLFHHNHGSNVGP